jgi:glycosyltransferase involved in cell wall biosynthesis
LKILIVNPHLHLYGGADLVIVKLANYLINQGIETSILTLSISEKVRNELKGVEIIIPGKQQGYKKSALSFIKEGFILWNYIRKNGKKYDVINIHNFPAEFSAFLCKKPTVWLCNEPPGIWPEMQTRKLSIFKKILYRLALESEKIIVKKYINKICVADEFNHVRLNRLYNIKGFINNYGIDYDFFSQGSAKAAKEKFNLHKNFIILQVALVIPFKNQLESIKTIEKLKDKIPNIKLVLAGGETKPDYSKEIKKYIKEHNLEKYILFTGNISREVVRDLYKAADVSLSPIKSQGGWLAPFEAISAGLPIIVSKNITCGNIIQREKIGTVTDNYTDAVLDVYKNPEKHKKITRAGQVFVKSTLTWDNFSEKMLESFKSVQIK